MKFGTYEVNTIETGHFALDGGAMFGVVPKNLWNRQIDADDQNRIPMTMRSLMIRNDDRVILVDTGLGNKTNEKFNKIYDVDLADFGLLKGLQQLGVSPNEVTDVVQTHLHFDHTGGATTKSDNGGSIPTFPNARYYVQEKHWEWAMNPTLKDRASFIREDFVPLDDHSQLELLDGPGELFPGIYLDVVNGHTIAQQMVTIIDGNRKILFAADLIPMSHHIPAPYIMGYDIQPLVTLEEKISTLTKAAKERIIVVFEHDRFLEAATVSADGHKFAIADSGSLEDLVQQNQ